MPTPMEERLAMLLEPAIEGLGYELVRIAIQGRDKPTIQVMAEKPDRTMSVEDCAILSREVSAILDVEDPMTGRYVLEVSSPGIDRPLTRPKDFGDFKGFEARVTTKVALEGRRRFKGRLLGLEGEIVAIETEDGEKHLDLQNIDKAKLVLTDDLIAAAKRGHVD